MMEWPEHCPDFPDEEQKLDNLQVQHICGNLRSSAIRKKIRFQL